MSANKFTFESNANLPVPVETVMVNAQTAVLPDGSLKVYETEIGCIVELTNMLGLG